MPPKKHEMEEELWVPDPKDVLRGYEAALTELPDNFKEARLMLMRRCLHVGVCHYIDWFLAPLNFNHKYCDWHQVEWIDKYTPVPGGLWTFTPNACTTIEQIRLSLQTRINILKNIVNEIRTV